jgi:hypothetical protein
VALVPVPVPALPVLWSKAVIDLEPMTRYGSPADVASVNSTICLHNPGPAPREVTLYAPSHWENEANLRVGQEARKPASPIREEPLEPERLAPLLADLRREAPAAATGLEAILARSRKVYAGTVEVPPGDLIVRYHTRLPIIAEPDGSYRFAEFVPRSHGAVPPGGELSVALVLPRWGPGYAIEALDWAQTDARGGNLEWGLLARDNLYAFTWYWRYDPVLWLRYRYRAAAPA